MQRKALLIGNAQYQDINIQDLTAPLNDTTELAKLLEHADIGFFDSVVQSIDEPSHIIRRKIGELFQNTRKDDVILLYFSGHGLVDDWENLYLATTDTDSSLPSATAIGSEFIRTQMDKYSHSKRQVIILDCCFSAKFMTGAKAAKSQYVPIDKAFEGDGFGRFILTATNGYQKAWEGSQIIGEEVQNSIFTYFVLEGLRTGLADKNNDGWIDVNDLYLYVYEKLQNVTTKQQPQRYVFHQQGTELRIAKAMKKVLSRPSIKRFNELQDDYYRFVETENWSAAKYVLDFISTLDDVPQSWLEHEYNHLEYAVILQGKPSYRVKQVSQIPGLLISKVYDILPAPFEWVEIPAGKVILVNDWDDGKDVYLKKNHYHEVKIPAFEIAKYPITNTQYACFIESGGYNKESYWTLEGWQEKKKMVWTEPRYWQDEKWNSSEQPVVGVSWYEAYAFTRWLHEVTGERISLPTEEQWQRAAQGDDGRVYPWGNEWDCKRCNSSVDPCDSDRTTMVKHYEGKGDSPFGVIDMAGNAWEWCLTAYYSGSNSPEGTHARVMRGSSWYNYYMIDFHVTRRDRYNPVNWANIRGFRIIRSY